MNAPLPSETPIAIGAQMAGGYYAGQIRVDNQRFALIVAPKAEGEHRPAIWIPNYTAVHGALSYNDGQANTNAMVDAGSELAKWARDLRIAGFDDWYLPSQDELEVLYRNLKPTAQTNHCWARSGINLNAGEPTPPYTPELPVQTDAELFREGGQEAFEVGLYWSSTQHASGSEYCLVPGLRLGYQGCNDASSKGRARAVRRLTI